MPTLLLKLAAPPSTARSQSLAHALTALTAGILGKRPEVTAVVIEVLPTGRWFVGGQAIERPTALLEISITAGTNTTEQKAAFIEAAHAELQRQLADDGAFEEASYVTVRELPATDWGYAGRSQRARQQEREAAPRAPA